MEKILEGDTARVDEFAKAMMLELGAPIAFAREAHAQVKVKVGIDHLKALIEDTRALRVARELQSGTVNNPGQST